MFGFFLDDRAPEDVRPKVSSELPQCAYCRVLDAPFCVDEPKSRVCWRAVPDNHYTTLRGGACAILTHEREADAGLNETGEHPLVVAFHDAIRVQSLLAKQVQEHLIV